MKSVVNKFREKAFWLEKEVLYHRGKHGNGVKENSKEAFELSIKDGISVELDVRLTKDECVVISHDNNLKRVYDIDKNIDECTYDEISEYTSGKIMLFEDLLKMVDDKIGLMIEIKSGHSRKLEEKVYNLLKNYKGRYVIVSFNPLSLRYFRKKDPSIIRGQLAKNFKDDKFNLFKKYFLTHMLFNFISKPHFISYGIENCNFKVLDKYRKKGYFIIGWTYKNEKNKEQLKEYYDNMIVEDLEIREF